MTIHPQVFNICHIITMNEPPNVFMILIRAYTIRWYKGPAGMQVHKAYNKDISGA